MTVFIILSGKFLGQRKSVSPQNSFVIQLLLAPQNLISFFLKHVSPTHCDSLHQAVVKAAALPGTHSLVLRSNQQALKATAAKQDKQSGSNDCNQHLLNPVNR